MIELKDAVEKSLDALKQIAIVPKSAQVELEEAELDDDGNFWIVTFSYPDPDQAMEFAGVGPNLSAILKNKRAYKAVRILASDGTVRGIKTIHV